MKPFCRCIFFPYIEIWFNIDSFYAVQSDNIKFSGRFIVFNRISGGSNDPARWNRMGTKCFILQKLQHSGNQRFGYTVDLIDKKDSFFTAGFFYLFINRSNDLAHGVFCYGIFFSLKILFYNDRETDSTLACMMCNCISNQSDSTFSGGLFHDRCFADTGRPDQENRSLSDRWQEIMAIRIFTRIDLYGLEKFLFCFFDIHKMWYPFCI